MSGLKLFNMKKKWLIFTSSHTIQNHYKLFKYNNIIVNYILLSPLFSTNTDFPKKGKGL